MHSQGVSSLNYRTFQVMACEKLLLCDYREEIDSLFNNKGFSTISKVFTKRN